MLEKNRNYIMEITGMTHESQGVGRIEGFAVFVDNALPGETIEVKIVKVNRNFAFGKLVKLEKASNSRRDPFCEAYGRCGGCNLQHLDYKAQLDFKTRMVKDSLQRIGGLKDILVRDTIGMDTPLNYRNKAQFPAAVIGGKPVTGFYAKRTHDVVSSVECLIQDRSGDALRKLVQKFIEEKNISIYNEKDGRGLLRHVMTRTGFATGDTMVVLVINGLELPYSGELVSFLTEQMPDIKSIFLNINKNTTNVILGDKNVKLFGVDAIIDNIGKYRFRISPHSFFQVNPKQTQILYGKALHYAGLTGCETVFDLYCGIGTISLFLSEKAAKVYGVEVVKEAVKDARENARLNGITNVEFLEGAAEEVIPALYGKGIRADVVVVDPPRKGCDQALLDTLVEMRPDRIVYVSCNPATLARDVAFLCGQGFKAEEVQPVDMFPWTTHVECIIMMTYCGSKSK